MINLRNHPRKKKKRQNKPVIHRRRSSAGDPVSQLIDKVPPGKPGGGMHVRLSEATVLLLVIFAILYALHVSR